MQDAASRFMTALSGAWQDAAHLMGARVLGVLVGAVILLVTWWVSGLAKSSTRRVLAKTSTAGHVDLVVSRLVQVAVVAVGIVFALGEMGLNMAALVTSLGLAGLTIGLALRDVLSNYVSGIMLLLHRPFTIGDTVLVDATEGEVVDVTTRATVLRASDGRMIHIPNSTVFAATVTNVTQNPVRRFEVRATLRGDADPVRARAEAVEALRGIDGVLADPGPEASVSSAGPFYARLVAHGWVDTRTGGLGSAQDAAFAAIEARLHAAGMMPPARGTSR